MSRIPTAFSSTPTNSAFNATDAINDIDLGTFLKLMIAELQNQDPLNPLDNKDMLAQISQIREVGATDKLTQTLEAVLLGQNIASATNLIGTDITAVSDAMESVAGTVQRVSIDKGVPKLFVESKPQVSPSELDGNIDAGTYAYRIVWEDDKGTLFGIDLSDDDAITTTGAQGSDRAIQIRNLPVTAGPKRVYRTDASGEGDYRLVGTITDGTRATFIDRLSDAERFNVRLTQPFQQPVIASRSHQVSLKNVSGIRPPAAVSDDEN